MKIPALAFVLLLAACPVEPDDPDAGPDPIRRLPVCAERGEVLGADVDAELEVLEPGAKLPVIVGFQGFMFVRVGLRAPRPLAATVDLGVHAAVSDRLDLDTSFGSLAARPLDGAWQTEDVPLMLNDLPMSELVGQDATVEVWAASGDCRVVASVDVSLSTGGFMGVDGGSPADAGSEDGGPEADGGLPP